MSRVKRGTTARRRRKKVLKQAKGYYGARSKTYQKANETLMRAWAYAYRDRRTKKRVMRRLWIIRINAAARLSGLSYSQFMHGIALAGIGLDRKVLADIAVHDQKGFERLAAMAKEHLPTGVTNSVSPGDEAVQNAGSVHA